VSYGTDNVISDHHAGNRMHFDPVTRVIRAGEMGMFLVSRCVVWIVSRVIEARGRKSFSRDSSRIHSSKKTTSLS